MKIDELDNKIVLEPQEIPRNFTKVAATKIQSECWPKGSYTFLQPFTGCPIGEEWETSWIRHDLERYSRLPNNLLQAEHQQDCLNISYCTKTPDDFGCSSAENQRFWPTGSYCVLAGRYSECPVRIVCLSVYDSKSKGSLGTPE